MMSEDGWYPVALADDIEPGTSTGTRLFGRELVVWRDITGHSHVWEDRCPHRGMRLSFGFVRGSSIACLYHGWQFDAGGRCRYIPAHPKLDVPASIAVERFASAERLGIIWVFSGDPSGAGTPPGGNAETMPVRSLSVNAPAISTVAALMKEASLLVEAGASGPLLMLQACGEPVYIAVQPTGAQETTLHVVVEPGSDRQKVSLWAEALRHTLEAEPTRSGVTA
ncbi:Rieske (2Fe-2S) protein [Lichenifustis flavocetrariae]|uniref:Rieske (2Fe-2S) protein n=1 Tax=Lichenifustis flavocetrariae TaxID=2949735 RepID=A0AA41Z0E5_9HYPH|nr:Rieske (2Fe-2S) protein [Lichenifustis flavocetrariae]MCW6507017.1 Rieske (2Fe-2S) protein [Lichenifustis flavocetrariae]